MYTLYYAPGAANMAPHAVLEEIGAPHKLVKLDLSAGDHNKPDYLKLNPKGRVPLLTDGDYVLSESAAIILFLIDRHPASGLAPQDPHARGHLYQWLLYLTNTLQPTFLEYFYAERWFEDKAQQAALKTLSEKRLGEMFAYIDASLAARGPYLLGRDFSAVDLFLHMLVRWSRWLDKPAYRYPAIRRCTDLVKARPAVQRMMKAEGLVEEEKA
jgi:glutathione S-transferase